MQENIGEILTIDDMARAAMYSKFHFSREFQRVTGVSPRRFLSAIRIQEAKRLLLQTTFTVTEISHHVGYNSVGTFSSRFAASVGVSPTMYRQLGGYTTRIGVAGRTAGHTSSVRGEVRSAVAGELGQVFVGLFPTRIPQGRPAGCAVLPRPGRYLIDGVPPGTWYLLAHSVPVAFDEVLLGDQEVFVGSVGPIEVRPDVPLIPADVVMRTRHAVDPPVLLALMDVRSAAVRVGLARTGTG
ncbi:helix-turn-helix transcriptional regulator [Streptomyces kaniharaensis]|uniref:Helix-turn-helix transcriptional regulator n=1 Tax=Streptomyces kaniharaensis TaxID=212423 RepID=A0A6N7KJM4_9ACTN|nr:helix-turn-helix transcriptional regulator [Streptomyces kaniharaensis]MQS10769.1 helix-turn-helix transcriptional regulator [Streptomyces kaniharaensis]